jgi:hypothetical protein
VIAPKRRFRDYTTERNLDDLKGVYKPQRGEYIKPTDNVPDTKRHALLIIGFRQIKKKSGSVNFHVLVKNSWKDKWGFNGYGWIKIHNPPRMDFAKEIHWIEDFSVDEQ